MRTLVARLSVLLLISIPGSTLGAAQEHHERSCDTVKSILDESLALRVGMTRAELEKFFSVGSFTFRYSATYVSKKCVYISLDVEFEQDASNPAGPPNAADRIKTISKPYLTYPSAD